MSMTWPEAVEYMKLTPKNHAQDEQGAIFQLRQYTDGMEVWYRERYSEPFTRLCPLDDNWMSGNRGKYRIYTPGGRKGKRMRVGAR